MAVKEFVTGKWYVYLGPYNPGEGWNCDGGYMDFVMDRKPHKCKYGCGERASFYDSEDPNADWHWDEEDRKYFHELGSPDIDWKMVMGGDK